MASGYGRHLDPVPGRSLFFCHQCQHEWYQQNERPDLDCPTCGSGAIETVEPGSEDPRLLADSSSIPLPSFLRMGAFGRRIPGSGTDSDPEEDDIDRIRFGPGSSSTRPSDMPRERSPSGPSQGNNRNGDVILQRFADMLMNDLGAGRSTRGGPESLFPGRNRGADDFDPFSDFPTTSSGPRVNRGPTTYHRTFTSGPLSGSTTFTIVSSSSNMPGGAAPPFPPGFPALFGQIMSNASPSVGDDAPRAGGSDARPPPGNMGFATGLHELLASLLNPANAVHGDAVYSQEALDRIITSLMEANPQSNAAPPASQTAIEKLEKKKLDDKMLGSEGKAECTICIDELHKGDEVTVLPCSHWFHGECVTLWLKEHNTCPICRAPIERNENARGSAISQQAESSSASSVPPLSSIFAQPRTRGERTTRSPRENEERLNYIRNGGSGGRYTSSSGYTSTLSRRNSMSPPTTYAETRSTTTARVRSPSLSRDQDFGASPFDRDDYVSGTGYGSGTGTSSRYQSSRDTSSRDNHSNPTTTTSSHGPLSWLRDHLGRSSGSGSGGSNRR